MASPRTPSRHQGIDLLQVDAVYAGAQEGNHARWRERQGLRVREGKCACGEKIAARVGERAVWRLQRNEERGKEKRVEVHLESGGGGAGANLLHPAARRIRDFCYIRDGMTPAASVTPTSAPFATPSAPRSRLLHSLQPSTDSCGRASILLQVRPFLP